MTKLKAKVRPYLPIPKVYVPFMTALVGAAVKFTATGALNRVELAALVGAFGYATISWLVPGAVPPAVVEDITAAAEKPQS